MPNGLGADRAFLRVDPQKLAKDIGRGGGNGAGVTKERPWPQMDEAAYYGLAGDVVRAISPNTEADAVAILLQYLSATGNMMGRGPYYRVERTRHYLKIYTILTGVTAKARKGTSWDRVLDIVEPVDPHWRADKVHGGLSSGEGLIWVVRDPIKAPAKKGKNASSEEVVDPGVTDKRLMVIEPEFSTVLSISRREGNILSRVIRDAFDSGNLATMTKNSPARATGAHISIIGHTTEDELRRELDRVSMANGLANRFLFACVKRARILPFGGAFDEETNCELGRRTREAVSAARKMGRLKMNKAARVAWRDVYPSLSQEKPGLLGAIIARGEAHTVRLALHYAVLDQHDEIHLKHLEAALAVWTYCEASAYRIFGDALGDPVADEIQRALDDAGKSGLTRTAIRDLFGRNRSADQIGRALDMLERHGRARLEKSPANGGRPPEVWFSTRGSMP